MTIGNFYHNPHFHVDGLVVSQILPDLDPHLVRSVAWIDGIPVILSLDEQDPSTNVLIMTQACQIFHMHPQDM